METVIYFSEDEDFKEKLVNWAVFREQLWRARFSQGSGRLSPNPSSFFFLRKTLRSGGARCDKRNQVGGVMPNTAKHFDSGVCVYPVCLFSLVTFALRISYQLLILRSLNSRFSVLLF
jgi:hypothetical protein